MKKIIFFGAIVMAVIFSACQHEYDPFDDDNTAAGGTGDFRAKIDGVQFVADSLKAASKMDSVIVITGISKSKKMIVLRVKDSGVHNYTMHNESMTNVAAFTDFAETSPISYATNQTDVPGSYGNLNITSIDTVNKKMSGTFTLKVFRQFDSTEKIITEGVFTNITYATQPAAPSATDTFRVKIDGTPFTYNLLVGIKTFNMISVSASTNAAPTVGITVPATVVPGSYPFDIMEYIGQYNPNTTTFLGADTGRVTILEHNTTTRRIRGNFHFLANTVFTGAPPEHQLTEGYFSVIYN
ncbi:MAG: DUF6252 family protein [Ferruginibacter sp.]